MSDPTDYDEPRYSCAVCFQHEAEDGSTLCRSCLSVTGEGEKCRDCYRQIPYTIGDDGEPVRLCESCKGKRMRASRACGRNRYA